jgi:hypothetical protein
MSEEPGADRSLAEANGSIALALFDAPGRGETTS